MILSRTTYSDYSGEKSFPKSTYTEALYRVEGAGSGIREINPYPSVARKTAAFCLKKKMPNMYSTFINLNIIFPLIKKTLNQNY